MRKSSIFFISVISFLSISNFAISDGFHQSVHPQQPQQDYYQGESMEEAPYLILNLSLLPPLQQDLGGRGYQIILLEMKLRYILGR